MFGGASGGSDDVSSRYLSLLKRAHGSHKLSIAGRYSALYDAYEVSLKLENPSENQKKHQEIIWRYVDLAQAVLNATTDADVRDVLKEKTFNYQVMYKRSRADRLERRCAKTIRRMVQQRLYDTLEASLRKEAQDTAQDTPKDAPESGDVCSNCGRVGCVGKIDLAYVRTWRKGSDNEEEDGEEDEKE